MMGYTARSVLDRPDESPPKHKRPPGGPVVTVLLMLASLGVVGGCLLWLSGLLGSRYTIALVALTQYWVPVGLVLVALTLLLRRWLTATVVAVATFALMLGVVPRAVPDSMFSAEREPAAASGTEVTVLTSNLQYGQGDPARIVRLVREHHVDVLSLQELSPQAVMALDQAGLGELLPHREFAARKDSTGSGIASRYPLSPLRLTAPSVMQQPSALVRSPGGAFEFVAAHPVFPVRPDMVGTWQRELDQLPPPAESGARPRILAGDFNSTLDHQPMRALLGRGYVDAAEVLGEGLRPTWPERGKLLPPPVTIDRVLLSGGVSARHYDVFDVPGSDHRAVLAKVVLPGG